MFLIGFAVVLFLCAGLVIDGGLAINKRMRVADDAEQAARIGADSIDVVAYRRQQGALVLDQALARQRMGDYLGSLGYAGGQWQPRFNGNAVSVTVTDTSKTYILNLFGIHFPVKATAEAVPDTGAAVPAP